MTAMNQALGIFFHAFPLWMMTDSEQQNVREDNLGPTYFVVGAKLHWCDDTFVTYDVSRSSAVLLVGKSMMVTRKLRDIMNL